MVDDFDRYVIVVVVFSFHNVSVNAPLTIFRVTYKK